MERDHASSLFGANEALKASTLRLPVIENAVVSALTLSYNSAVVPEGSLFPPLYAFHFFFFFGFRSGWNLVIPFYSGKRT